MKPYEHYLEAERLLEGSEDNSSSAWTIEMRVARAAVHAQLALVDSTYSDSVIDLKDIGAYIWIRPNGNDEPITIHPNEIQMVMRSGYTKK